MVRDGKWPKMESGSRGWKMKAVPGDGRTLKMELLPNILLTLVMLAIGECEQYSMKLKLNIQGSGIFYRISGVFKGFLDALASLKPILFSYSLTNRFQIANITSESISENELGLFSFFIGKAITGTCTLATTQ